MTRLEACREIRKNSLFTKFKGGQDFTFEVVCLRKFDTTHLIGIMHCQNGMASYGLKVNWKQVLTFIKQNYPKFENDLPTAEAA